MLKSLTIQGGFAHKDSHFNFEGGLTVVTGPNGSGKSEILDMIRFALFGSGALRTPAPDYKKHRVVLTFGVRGVDYTVERSTANAKLLREGDVLAVGTRPVNDRIRAIFGYDLTVFDTAHAVTQGALLELLSARPAERKRLVDQTLGLDGLANLITRCRAEASTLQGQVEALERVSPPPAEPVRPEGYRPSSVWMRRRDRVRVAARLRGQLAKALSCQPQVGQVPVWPHPWQGSEVEAHQARRAQVASALAAVERLVLPVPELTLEEIEQEEAAHEVHATRKAFAGMPPPPPYTLAELDQMEAQLWEHDRWRGWHRLAEQGGHVCPKCAHRWWDAEEEMNRYGDWQDKPEPPMPPLTTMLNIQHHRKLVDAYTQAEKARAELAALPDVPEPRFSRKQLEAMKMAHTRADVRAKAEELRKELEALPDRKADLRAWEFYVRERKGWEAAKEAFDKWEALRPRAERQLRRGDWIADAMLDIDRHVQAAHQFEADYRSWQEASRNYEKVVATLAQLRDDLRDWRGAAEALGRLRTRVKTHLAPSLSRAASSLLARMTSGALNTLAVSEDFDVTVDGKAVEGLSGAGKAAANLALRIALGYVLTNRVFSVLLADEVDAGMDAERAEATARAFQNLTSTLKQVLLVTHKTPEGDHYIRL